MDKIWFRNPTMSEVIGRCGGDKKRMTTQNRQKSNAKKKKEKKLSSVVEDIEGKDSAQEP